MELAIIIVANLVLLALLVLALILIRRPDHRPDDETIETAVGVDPERAVELPDAEATTDITDAEPAVAVAEPTSRETDESATSGALDGPPDPPADHPTTPPLTPIQPIWPDAAPARPFSVIEIHASFNGSGPAPEQLYADVLDLLGQVGFAPVPREEVHTQVLRDRTGRLAKTKAGRDPEGRVRIDVALDSDVAVETLARLEVWHRDRLDHSEKLELKARIR